MPNYNNFQQVLQDRKLNDTAKNAFVKRWLQTTYGIDFNSNQGFFTELTRVHDHDGQPKHFGRIMLDTTAGVVWVQVIRLAGSNKWRLGLFFTENATQPDVLNPLEGSNDRQMAQLEQFKTLVTAPPRGSAPVLQSDGVQFANLDSYSTPAADDAFEQHHVSANLYEIPAFLYDPAYVPGTAATRKDPSLNLDFEQVVAAFARP